MKQHNSIFRDSFIRDKIKNNFQISAEELASKKDIIRTWVEKIKLGLIYNKKEVAQQDDFIKLFFGDLLEYTTTLDSNDIWNIEREKKTDIDGKKPDGTFGYFYNDSEKNVVTAVLELKEPRYRDLDRGQNRSGDKRSPVDQGFDYAHKYTTKNGKVRWVLISNFTELRLYSSDTSTEYERFNIENLLDDEELKRFLYLLSKDHILDGKLGSLIELNVKEEMAIEKKFYADYKKTRYEIIQEVIKENPTTSKELVIEKTQKLLDRFLFIAFCEDKHFIPANIFKSMVGDAGSYLDKSDMFNNLCNFINVGNPKKGINKFNGGLFKNDEILNSLIIPDSVFDRLEVIAEYDFSTELDENILGHIFEQSLNDLEELKAEYSGENFDKTKSKRKKDGVFYTPKHITRKIVETSIQNYIEDKKVKLGYYSLPELEAKDYDIKRVGKTEKLTLNAERHLTYLRKLRKEIMNVKIVDPACGSGAFLITAFDVLMEEMNKINMQIQDLGKNQQSFFDSLDSDDELYSSAYDNEILKNCLYGVDLNKESVEITRLSLWLRTLSKDKPLTNLDKNIKVGNSLIDDPEIAGDLAFDWEKEFPEIFEQGGFDIVVGNPPYVLCQPSNTSSELLDYYKKYQVASYKIDLFHLFFEIAIKVTNEKASIGYITPNTYFTNKYTEKLRNYILENSDISEIVNYQDTVFEDAGVDVATIILNKRKSNNNEIKIFDSKTGLILLKKQEEWENDKNKIFNLNESLNFHLENIVNLGDIYSVSFGLQTKNKSIYVSEIKEDNLWEECYTGKDISRYHLSNSSLFFKNLPEEVKAGGSWNMEYHKKKKIVVRQVGNPEPIFAYDNFSFCSLNTMYNIVNQSEDFDDFYVLAILNSKFIKKYWESKYNDNKDLFPKIKGHQIKELPIKNIPLTEQEPFIKLADAMLNLNEEFRTETNKFQRLFIRNFSLEKVSKKLSTWYDLDFKDFVKELKKAKVKLSLSDEMEWEDVFVNKKEEVIKLKSEIEKTDAQIDDLVYKLYELTPEEIEIIKEG